MHMFDKLFAVSDLHIGGPPGKRAFREASALAGFIRYVAEHERNQEVALLLNGDVFDFLAEENARAFAFDAHRIIRSLAADVELKPIFAALKEFAAASKRTLVIQIGNHDIEMVLPTAQAAFLECLGVSTDCSERVVFETRGRGWTCRVGGRTILAVHGNASDPWNAVDLPGLRATAAALTLGRSPVPAPNTNAGTSLVLDVMNDIKRRFPIVDLLKPEGAPLIAVLYALDAPTSARGLLHAVGRIRVQRGTFTELLGEDGRIVEASPGPSAEILSFVQSIAPPASSPTERLERAERNLHARRSPRDLVNDEDDRIGSLTEYAKTLPYRLTTWLANSRAGEPQLSTLREALSRWLSDDQIFGRQFGSAMDKRIIASAGPGIDVVIAGHTHLPRELQCDDILYINTGTWMRLLKLNGGDYLQNDEEFARFFDASKNGQLKALDDLGIDPQWRPVAVVDASMARLMSVSPSGIPEEFSLEGAS